MFFFLAAVLLVAPAAAGRLSVLLLVSDDLTSDLGFSGGPAVTPHLDAFARRNGTVAFSRAYAQQAICNPSRASFLTSRRPDTTRVWDLKTQFRTASGPRAANWSTLPLFFRRRGYATAGMGKIFHPVPWRNASDDVAGGSWSVTPYFHGEGGEDTKHPLSETNCGLASPVASDEAFTDGMVARHAVETLRDFSRTAQPFFLAVGFHRPHLPWIVPQKYFDLYPEEDDIPLAACPLPPVDYNATGAQPFSWDPQSGPRHCAPLYGQTYPAPALLPEYGLVDNSTARHFRRSYWAAVSQMDRNVGIVLAELHRLGLADSTLTVIMGDHGWQLGDLGEWGKKTLFERATRAPLLVRDPRARSRPAAESRALVEFVDVMPTVIDLALGANDVPLLCPEGDPSGPAECTEGASLRNAMEHPSADFDAERPAAFMQYAACMHDEKVWHDACANPTEPRVMGYGMRTRRWRYIEWVRFDRREARPLWNETTGVLGTELYDHGPGDTVRDAAEAVNLVARPAYKETVMRLSAMLRRGWRGRGVVEVETEEGEEVERTVGE